ncbi:MAG: HesA/MoeB/ThiF family protein [Romboutsia sp.]|uniref:HesA/MoeB/ThiF family protein n=1 Tax=Romboutsia sp. TaxID=1965302 RepID=UPI003F323C7C
MYNRYKQNIGILTPGENKKLKNLKICVIGCGGLGGYIIDMLSRLGVGYITCVDGDFFEESNLNRQLYCNEKNLGLNKAKCVKEKVKQINSSIYINAIDKFLEENNSINILRNHDLIIDAIDNIKGRFIIQDTCKILKTPIIHGAISGWYGQVTTILPGDDSLNYIYKNKENEIKNNLGNPSFTPAHVASIQVSESIKLLFNKGEILSGKILLVDLLYNDQNIISINKNN